MSAYDCPASDSVDAEDREQWLAVRRTGIGGSDLPAILGMSRWDSPRDIWLDKTGRSTTDVDSWPIRRGNALERPLVTWFIEHTDTPVLYPVTLQRNKNHPWMLGTPDGLTADGGVLECKTTSWWMRDEWADGAADYAVLQGQWYLAVTGRRHLWVIAAISDDEPTIEHVERNDAVIATMIEAAGRFWHEHVEADVEPPLTWMDRDTIAREFRTVERTRVNGNADIEHEIQRRADAVVTIKSCEKIKDEAEARIIATLGDADHLVINGKIAATRKAQTSRVLDRERLVETLDSLGLSLEDYKTERISRVLRVLDPEKRKAWKD